MISALLIYDQKGEVLISRLYRQDIRYVSFDTCDILEAHLLSTDG
jgi:hypothetical protein